MAQKKRPLIGVTMDYSTHKHYSDYPWFVLRENYVRCFEDQGAIVIPIPHNHDRIDDYLSRIDGLVVTGGNFDHDPSTYGDSIHPKTMLNSKRSAFDLEMTRRALDQKMPFFGICAGMQALNIVRGGTLYQYIPDQIPGALDHSQEECRHIAVHDLDVIPGTLLARCNKGKTHARTNTSHQQSVKDIGHGLVVSGVCPDGVIEVIEDPSMTFCLGAQWHPEFLVTDLDHHLIQFFLEACQS